jgi:hypothetical protein
MVLLFVAMTGKPIHISITAISRHRNTSQNRLILLGRLAREPLLHFQSVYTTISKTKPEEERR